LAAEDKGKERDEALEKLLQAGQLAKVRHYQTLVQKMAAGTITAQELSQYYSLERELEGGRKNGADGPAARLSLEEAAALAGISKRGLLNHVTRGNVRRDPDGSFLRAEVERFKEDGPRRYAKGRRRRSSGEEEELDAKERADLRWREGRARREWLLVEQLEGKLISREEVERAFADRAHEFARALLLFSRRVGHRVAEKSGRKLKAVIEIMDGEAKQIMDAYTRPVNFDGEVLKK